MIIIDEYDKIFLKSILIIFGGLIGLIISMHLLTINGTLLAVVWSFISIVGIAVVVCKTKIRIN